MQRENALKKQNYFLLRSLHLLFWHWNTLLLVLWILQTNIENNYNQPLGSQGLRTIKTYTLGMTVEHRCTKWNGDGYLNQGSPLVEGSPFPSFPPLVKNNIKQIITLFTNLRKQKTTRVFDSAL